MSVGKIQMLDGVVSTQPLFQSKFTHIFLKLDHFINISNIYGFFMKRSSLQTRVSKFTPKKFYEFDPWLLEFLSTACPAMYHASFAVCQNNTKLGVFKEQKNMLHFKNPLKVHLHVRFQRPILHLLNLLIRTKLVCFFKTRASLMRNRTHV